MSHLCIVKSVLLQLAVGGLVNLHNIRQHGSATVLLYTDIYVQSYVHMCIRQYDSDVYVRMAVVVCIL